MPRAYRAPAQTPIRSRQNARLKELRDRLRNPGKQSDHLIALEGEHLVEEAFRSQLRVHSIFVREGSTARMAHLDTNAPIYAVAADVFNYTCVTDAPQGIAALVEAPQRTLPPLLRAKDALFVISAGIQDPGNLGTIIRSSEAFGATALLLMPGTVSPWNQKALRASAGSAFRVPLIFLADVNSLGIVKQSGIRLYATSAREGTGAEQARLKDSIAMVLGNEGAGIPNTLLALCDDTIRIPCPGPVESLNAAVAASILLYEASRQRGLHPGKGKRGLAP